MRLTAWSSLALAALLVAFALGAAPSGLADERGWHGADAQPVGPVADSADTTTGTAGDSSSGAADVVPAPTSGEARPGVEPSAALHNTEAARLRIKDYIRRAYSLREESGRAGSPEVPLDDALAVVDGLPAGQVEAIDARLAPALWLARGVALREGEAGPDDLHAPAQAGDTEALRRDIDAYFARFQPYTPLAGTQAAVYSQLLSSGRQRVAAMSDKELAALLDLFASLPSARAVLDTDPAAILGPPPRGSSFSSIGGPGDDASARVFAGSIHTNSSCADMAFGPVVTVTFKAIAEAADDFAELLSDDYMVSSFNIPEIPRLVAKTIALAADLLSFAMEADMEYFDNCNDNAHQALFLEHAAETTNRMSEIGSLLEDDTRQSDLKRILDNRMDRIDVFNAEYRDLTLRLAIEKDLVRHGDARIAPFQVPVDMCVTVGEHTSCGHLETVREIVADTIDTNRSAGFDTTLAAEALADGDDQMALGNYKEAYTRFRYAYQLAVRSD